MKNLLALFLITAFLFQSCDSKTENKTSELSQPTQKTVVRDKFHAEKSQGISTPETDLLEVLPVRSFPITDSTNFDNFEKSGMPDNGFLKQINLEIKDIDAKNFRLNYKIPFSENFTSVAITYQSGEHELFTSLITLSKENKIIDMLKIAYDEIAESAFRKMSKIEKDKIVVTSWNWMSGEPVAETETYILQNDGKFKMVQSDRSK